MKRDLQQRGADRHVGAPLAQALVDRAGRVADLELQVPEHVEHRLDDALAPGGLLVGKQEQEVDVRSRRQRAAAVAAGGDDGEALAPWTDCGRVEVPRRPRRGSSCTTRSIRSERRRAQARPSRSAMSSASASPPALVEKSAGAPARDGRAGPPRRRPARSARLSRRVASRSFIGPHDAMQRPAYHLLRSKHMSFPVDLRRTNFTT